MKPHEQCKAAGLNGLAELTKLTGVSKQTLINWSENRPELFKIILAGVRYGKEHIEIKIALTRLVMHYKAGRISNLGYTNVKTAFNDAERLV